MRSLRSVGKGTRYAIRASRCAALSHTPQVSKGMTFIKMYKRQITDYDRQQMAQVASRFKDDGLEADSHVDVVVSDNLASHRGYSINYTLGWKLYLVKTIIEMSENSGNPVFDTRSRDWDSLSKLVKDAYGSEGSSGIMRLLPSMNKGQVKLKMKHAEVGLEFSSGKRGGERTVQFPALAHRVIDLYSAAPLASDGCPMYIFIDEIELSYGNSRSYVREAKFIGDLIRAADDINDIARNRGIPVYVVLALRNEVLRVTANIGAELNKPIEDWGIRIDWRIKADECEDSPLLEIVAKRIASNLPEGDDRRLDIWKSFFPEQIDRQPAKTYVMKQTWSKPRDVVRLLNTLQEFCGESETFTEQMFFSIRREYARRAWNEIEEELNATRTKDFIEGVQKILSGIKRPFTVESFVEKIELESKRYRVVEKVPDEMRPVELIELLFKHGVIGNVPERSGGSGKYRFAAYGEEEPLLDGYYDIHYPLRNRFSS